MSRDPVTDAPRLASRVWTVPNLLSMLRLLGVPLFVWAIVTERDGIALATLMASGVTDYLDGKIARSFGLSSTLGASLDPIADRLYIFTTVLGLAYRGIIPWWLVALLVGRDLVLSLALLAVRDKAHRGLPVHFVGKAATFNLLYAFPLLLMADGTGWVADVARPVGWAFTWWGVGLYLLSGAVYLRDLAALGAAGEGRTRAA